MSFDLNEKEILEISNFERDDDFELKEPEDDDIYEENSIEILEEDDEISLEEAGFMLGYLATD